MNYKMTSVYCISVFSNGPQLGRCPLLGSFLLYSEGQRFSFGPCKDYSDSVLYLFRENGEKLDHRHREV